MAATTPTTGKNSYVRIDTATTSTPVLVYLRRGMSIDYTSSIDSETTDPVFGEDGTEVPSDRTSEVQIEFQIGIETAAQDFIDACITAHEALAYVWIEGGTVNGKAFQPTAVMPTKNLLITEINLKSDPKAPQTGTMTIKGPMKIIDALTSMPAAAQA